MLILQLVTVPVGSNSAPAGAGEERARLVADLVRHLKDWERALGAAGAPVGRAAATDVDWAMLRQRALELQGRAAQVGFGGIGHHLNECLRLLEAGGTNVEPVRARLQTIAELTWQAKQELGPDERVLLERFAAEAASGRRSTEPAPPPMITGARPVPAGLNAAAPSPVSSGPPKAAAAIVGPPPLMMSGVVAAAPPFVTAPVPPPVGPPVAPALGFGPQAPPLPIEPAPITSPLVPPMAGPAIPLGGPPIVGLPPALSPVPPAAPPPPSQPQRAPRLLVRTMFGLRAFGKQGAAKEVAAARGRAPEAAPPPGLLGLRSLGSSPPGQPAPPPLVGGDPSGLPPLPAGLRGQKAGGVGGPGDAMQSLLHRSGGVRDRAPARRSAPPRRRAAEKSFGGWWLGVVVAVAFGGLAITTIILLTRRDDAEDQPSAATSGASTSSSAPTSIGADAPRERLVADDERFKALLAQVHGRGGKESPELRALVEEQAAIASRALSMPRCNPSDAACAAWAEARDLIVGKSTPLVKRRRAQNQPDRLRSKWLVGLKLPDIPIEDDPRVERVLEYYAESPVGRETFQSMLFRCGAYRDMIQATLIRHGLPADVMAVVFAESGCEPRAKSPVGAKGLWQFMPETARAYHLRVIDDKVDERQSPPKSTEAAIKFLADVYAKLGSWDLVFASYNMGPFGLIARIERVGGDVGFWDLVDADLLPDETANYVPTIQAMALILENLQRFKFAGVQMRSPQLTADLDAPPGTRLGLIARAAATSIIDIRSLNLDILGDTVPDVPGGRFAVQVRKEVVWQARDALKGLLDTNDNADLCVNPTFDWGKQRFTPEMQEACKRRGPALEPPPPD